LFNCLVINLVVFFFPAVDLHTFPGGEQCRDSLSCSWGKASLSLLCLARWELFPWLAGTVGGLGSEEQQRAEETPVSPRGRRAGPLPALSRPAVTAGGGAGSDGSRCCQGTGSWWVFFWRCRSSSPRPCAHLRLWCRQPDRPGLPHWMNGLGFTRLLGIKAGSQAIGAASLAAAGWGGRTGVARQQQVVEALFGKGLERAGAAPPTSP